MALRPQSGDISGSRRDLGDILVVDVGHCRSCISNPLTVCLVVLGRHVERLAFLDVIFGDTPPLTPVENFYQRMLAGDASEVSDQAEQFLKTNSLLNYYDEVVLQALLMARKFAAACWTSSGKSASRKRSTKSSGYVGSCRSAACSGPATETFVWRTQEVVLPTFAPSLSPSLAAIVEAPMPDLPRAIRESEMLVLCIAGRSFLDEAAAALFLQILEKHGMGAKVGAAGALTADRVLAPFGRG